MRFLPLLLLSCTALADPVLRNAGSTLGPVTTLDAAADGGLTASRLNGVGALRCAEGGVTVVGCVTLSSQAFAGDKLFTGKVNISQHVTDAGAVTAAGAAFTSTLGAGGASSGATPGGTGGAYSFTAGPGGASAGAGNGGTGGAVTIAGGIGGAGAVGRVAGSGGNVVINSGAAGAASGGTGNSSGNITIDTGAPSGAGTAGAIFIGGGNSNGVLIGRPGPVIEVAGPGVMSTGEGIGGNVLMTQVGNAAMTAGELAVSFPTLFHSPTPSCVCTHVNTTNSNPCSIKNGAVPTLSGVTFVVASGGTDVVHWSCVGGR